MKKISGVFLLAVLLLALTSCGKSEANEWQEQYDQGEQYLQEEEKAYELTGDEEIAQKLETAELVMGDEPLVDEDTIAYIAKHTADLYYTDDTAVGTVSLYVCSEKEAILCVEASEDEDVFDTSVLWNMKFNNSEYNNGVYQGWYAEISWNYEDDGVVSEFFYFNYDEDMNGDTETAGNEWLPASETSVTELDGNVYTQMRFVIPDDDTFEFQVLDDYSTIEGYLSSLGC
ncbi:MAG: hypothetical protein LUE24_14865 [Lachnospiraceae bacterium]|nr:hypothetical protein [Lachnospiraceae bacterium]